MGKIILTINLHESMSLYKITNNMIIELSYQLLSIVMVHHQTKAIHNEKEVSSSPKKSINAVIEKAQNAKDILHM